MSQQTAKPGRRTPLSLGQPKGDASDKSQIRTGKATVNLEKLSTDLLTKQAKNGSAEDNNKAENGQNNATNNGATAKKDGNGVHIEEANDKGKLTDKVKDNKTASPKVSEKVVEKAKPSNDKVQTTNDKQKPSIDSASGISKIEEKADAKNGDKEVRESVRQKHLREEKEKEDSVKVAPTSQTKVAPSTPDKNSEAPNAKDKRKPEVATPTKTPKALPSESLLAEKSLKGFNENLEEAESSKITDSPMPAKDSKLLKFSQAPPMSASRNKRSDKLEDASLVVNLSTVSELSNESTNNSTPVERNYSLRHITGRRSTRPLREISFEYRKHESYYNKERNNETADSISNVNVTSSSESPRVGGQFKRTVDDDEVISPKRSRFDFGLLEFVSSPVKKLGEKFSRSRLSTSTPNKLTAIEVIPSGIEAEHFAAEDDDEIAPIELNAVDDVVEKKMAIDTELPAEDEAPIEVHEPSKSRCSVM
ncbi:uncharacterized protein LOC119067587 isoform X2 [Bradysia coprophila]|nr:uncharacterized protein LOC119067587 isoform X2 [Bradysia coprophila]